MKKIDKLNLRLHQLMDERKKGVERRQVVGDRYPSVSSHHVAMRKRKGLPSTGGQLARTCETSMKCPDVYVGFSYSAGSGKTPYLLCTNPRHYKLVDRQTNRKLARSVRSRFIAYLDRRGRVAEGRDVRFALELYYEINDIKEQIAELNQASR